VAGFARRGKIQLQGLRHSLQAFFRFLQEEFVCQKTIGLPDRPFVTVLPTDFGDVGRIQVRPRLSEGNQLFLFVELGARLVIAVVCNLRFEHFSDDFAFNGLAFVDCQSPVVLEKIRLLEFGNGQDVCFQ